MKARNVLIKYNKIVPFPWSVSKIEKAHKNPAVLLMDIGKELAQCEDTEGRTFEILQQTLAKLQESLKNP